MASSRGFTVEEARRYLAHLNAAGEIKLAKPAAELKPDYAKRIANELRRQEQAGVKQFNYKKARGKQAGEHHKGTITRVPAQGRVYERNVIGVFPKHLKGERDSNGKLYRSGVYNGGRVQQVPDIIKLVNRSTKTNTIAIGIYGYVSRYYDQSFQPGIQWLGFVADKREFLKDLQALNTGQQRDAQDADLRALAMKYMNYKRPASEATEYQYIFGWSARDARQP